VKQAARREAGFDLAQRHGADVKACNDELVADRSQAEACRGGLSLGRHGVRNR